jgi:hypothetical protein
MKALAVFAVLMVALGASPAKADDLAPGGTLRAVYLATNPAQAVRDPATGAILASRWSPWPILRR